LICLLLVLVAAHGGDYHNDDKSVCGSVEEKEDYSQRLHTAAIFIVMGVSLVGSFFRLRLAMVIVVATETELILSQTKNPTTDDNKDKSLEAYDPAVTLLGSSSTLMLATTTTA
ncbi:unnamed protein product, partial [Aphanomyces euteiches]